MTDIYHIAYQLIAQYGTGANEEATRKIRRYTESHNYNALKTWYDVEEALSEIQKLKPAEATPEPTLQTTTIA
jgi:hypothetical protein